MQSGQHFYAVKVVGIELGTLLKALGIAGCPPVSQVSVGVILSALVVKSVRHLVAYHHTYGTIVEGFVGLRVEERILQDACGKQISLVVGL